MKIYSPIINHFTPSRRLNRKNRLKNFTSNTSLTQFNINNINSNSNQELTSQTLRVSKRKLNDIKNSKFPKIIGNITITD